MKKQKTKQTNPWMITTLILMLLIVLFGIYQQPQEIKDNSYYTIPNIGNISINDLNYVANKLNTKTLTICNLETKICKQVTKLK